MNAAPLSQRRTVLETPRTRLCVPVPDDAELTRAFAQDRTVRRYMGISDPSVEEERRRIAEHIRTHHEKLGYGLFLVVDRKTGEALGRAGIHRGPIPDVEPLEINYLIVPEHRGRGLATEVVGALVRWAEEEVGLERMAALIAPENASSIRVAERAGFRLVDTVDYPALGQALRLVWTAGEAGAEPEDGLAGAGRCVGARQPDEG